MARRVWIVTQTTSSSRPESEPIVIPVLHDTQARAFEDLTECVEHNKDLREVGRLASVTLKSVMVDG